MGAGDKQILAHVQMEKTFLHPRPANLARQGIAETRQPAKPASTTGETCPSVARGGSFENEGRSYPSLAWAN